MDKGGQTHWPLTRFPYMQHEVACNRPMLVAWVLNPSTQNKGHGGVSFTVLLETVRQLLKARLFGNLERYGDD